MSEECEPIMKSRTAVVEADIIAEVDHRKAPQPVKDWKYILCWGMICGKTSYVL